MEIDQIDQNDALYQVYVDRGNGRELDGCWGSEEAEFVDQRDAEDCARGLLREYPDCAWLVVDERDGEEVFRVECQSE